MVDFKKEKGIWTKEDYEIFTGELGGLLREKEFNFFNFLNEQGKKTQAQKDFQNFILLQKQGALKLQHKEAMLKVYTDVLFKYLEKQDDILRAYSAIGSVPVVDSMILNEATMTKQLALKLAVLVSLGLCYLDYKAKSDEILLKITALTEKPLLQIDDLTEFAFILD
ncbi:TPA_asm: hypothetical protein [Altiarchaeum virus]|nr:MAG: hypothetical protein BWK75_06310 [Candidatus Altiarchaeales archaeon A3]DAZ85561.1 TPA_asm: hypothetical protein [Altiarchaeum virus]